MSPQQLSEVMHKYFEATFEPIKKHGGLVVNLKGDSFLAIWKAARAEVGLRRQACLAAVDVAKAVHRFNGSFENLSFPTRVGVHSGQIFLGNIGAGDHYEYGPTGDTVNTASRLESLDKELHAPDTDVNPCRILIGETTMRYLGGRIETDWVGDFNLKGKQRKIGVYRVLGRSQADRPILAEEVER